MSNTRERRLRTSGRTLLELCVALALFAAMSAISAPRLTELSTQLNLRRTVSALEEITRSLPTLARQFAEPLSLKASSGQVRLATRSAPVRIIRTFNIPRNLTIRINTADQRILAHPGGALSPAKITIVDKFMRCSLTLSLWGRIRTTCSETP